MANTYMKGFSTSLIIREMQNKTTMGYHFIPVRIAIINKVREITNACEDVENRERLYTVGKNVNCVI